MHCLCFPGKYVLLESTFDLPLGAIFARTVEVIDKQVPIFISTTGLHRSNNKCHN